MRTAIGNRRSVAALVAKRHIIFAKDLEMPRRIGEICGVADGIKVIP
jgi:hypothetical protein